MKHSAGHSNIEKGIAEIGLTSDLLTSRAGMALFARYIDRIGISWFLERWLGPLRKSSKGVSAAECVRQILLFFIDGTSRHLTYFDELKADPGYAATIERKQVGLVSSHAVKRFIGSFKFGRVWLLRRLLQELFIWRLSLAAPKVVILDVDAMVMDNDEAKKREGVRPTYKKVKGFAPLQLVWERTVVDAVFRAGNHHSNHADTTEKMIRHIVQLIRRRYSTTVPIIIRLDAGYFDQKLFELHEDLGVGYVCGGKFYADIKRYVASLDTDNWGSYQNGPQEWTFVEFANRRSTWQSFRRTICCRPTYEDRQMLLEFARPDTLIYTNIGMGSAIDEALEEAGAGHLLEASGLVELYHGRGCDELVHRAFKDFVDQRLPFKGFRQNTVYYYLALVAFALFEAFKADVSGLVVPATAYATTVRRRLLDVAGKIVRHAGKIILKVTQTTLDRLRFDELWLRCSSPPPIPRFA